MMRVLASLGFTTIAAVILLVAAMPAAAAGGKEVVRSGSCSGGSDWKLKLKLDDGRIETEFEVDQNVNGQDWRVTLKRNGSRFFRGIRTTHAPSGSFEVNRRPNNGPGPDRIKGRAVNLQTGQVCTGAATI
jgi:hypothetical protein